VHNELEIAGPVSTLAKANDTWITSKIKSKLLIAESVQSDRVVVITENGATYLMGLVTNDEAERAADIARNTSGVRKVVKIFEIIE
jgi:osmotically-inducible protein OsmY